MTPFLCAVAAGHTNCAKILLESGADLAARDKYQRCCIHLAVENNKEDALKMVLERSGPGLVNIPDVHERTALHYAAVSTNTRVIIVLVIKFKKRKFKMRMYDKCEHALSTKKSADIKIFQEK